MLKAEVDEVVNDNDSEESCSKEDEDKDTSKYSGDQELYVWYPLNWYDKWHVKVR